jgi:hypothetical protein
MLAPFAGLARHPHAMLAFLWSVARLDMEQVATSPPSPSTPPAPQFLDQHIVRKAPAAADDGSGAQQGRSGPTGEELAQVSWVG